MPERTNERTLARTNERPNERTPERTNERTLARTRVIAKGALFEIFLNGRKLFEVENDTFPGAGKVGLWTKADAVTQFDDLRVASLHPGD